MNAYETIDCVECGGPTPRARPRCSLCQSDEGLFISPPTQGAPMIHLARLRTITSQAREFTTAAEDFAIAQGNRGVIAARVAEDALPPSSLAAADQKVSEAEWKFNYLRDGLRRLMENEE